MDKPKVSIVIPAKSFNKNLKECLKHCLDLDYPDFEIIVLPDSSFNAPHPKVKVIPTGLARPAEKRDIALSYCKGEVLAFIDDDAYPANDWLRNAIKYFQDSKVAAVGGPAVTPETDGLMQKASGLVYSSSLCSGNLAFRYVPKKQREVDDYPSCNLIVRKSILEEIGGFDTNFWPGEDTKLCLQITNDLRQKIIYAPDVLVYHHRRPLFAPHLKQVWRYALHRGYFAKKFPQTSLRVTYFIPTLFVLGLIFGLIAAWFNPISRILCIAVLAIYLFSALLAGLQGRNPRIVLAVSLGIVVTHICYGLGFLKGLFSRRLKEEKI